MLTQNTVKLISQNTVLLVCKLKIFFCGKIQFVVSQSTVLFFPQSTAFSRFANYSLPLIRVFQIPKRRPQDKQAKEGISGDLQQRLSSASVLLKDQFPLLSLCAQELSESATDSINDSLK